MSEPGAKAATPFLMYAYAAPIVLVFIAALQIVRAHLYSQSPWKGGGFGMFASNSSPGSFYLRTFVITPDGAEAKASTPGRLSRFASLVRTVPTAENLLRYTVALTRETWVPYDYHRRVLADENPLIRVPDDVDKDRPPYRVVGSREPPPSAKYTVIIRGARVELWKVVFEASTRTVRREKWLEGTFHTGDPSGDSPSSESWQFVDTRGQDATRLRGMSRH